MHVSYYFLFLLIFCCSLLLCQCGMAMVIVPLVFVLEIYATLGNASMLRSNWKNSFSVKTFGLILCLKHYSDVSEIPEETYPLLKNCEILVLVITLPYFLFFPKYAQAAFLYEIDRIIESYSLGLIRFMILQDGLRPDRSTATHFGLPRVITFTSFKLLL